jgi:hypothetical protein
MARCTVSCWPTRPARDGEAVKLAEQGRRAETPSHAFNSALIGALPLTRCDGQVAGVVRVMLTTKEKE